MARLEAAIVGVAQTEQGTFPDRTAFDLQVEAAIAAVADAGMVPGEIDGVLTHATATLPEQSRNHLRLGEQLGLYPTLSASTSLGGATALSLLQTAAHAVTMGTAKAVLCAYGDATKTGGYKFDGAAGWEESDSAGLWGMFAAAANSAMTARRHMHQYGTTYDDLAAVATTIREHARLNPRATMRKPMTIADHHASRWVIEPLRLLDCCPIADGGVAFVVTTPERAKASGRPWARIVGSTQAHSSQTIGNPEWWHMEHQRTAVESAYRQAGVTPSDIRVAQLYDNFTIAVITWLEHAGFVPEGQGGAFVSDGNIKLGGALPVNTAGGNLSDSPTQGWLLVIEAVRQIRGECGPRQIEGIEHSLVTGRGMALNCSAAAVLRTER